MSIGSPISLRPGMAWVSALAIACILIVPLLPAGMLEAADARSSQRTCDPGFILNDETGKCEPFTIQGQIQAPPTCEPGSAITEQCEPEVPGDFEQIPQECPEGTERIETTGECTDVVPEDPKLAQECPAGAVLDQPSGQCVEETATEVPPAEPTNLPEAGQEPPPVEHTISLTKLTCPEGTDPEIGHGALLAACPVTPDVEFTLTFGGGATSTTSTNAAGVASWTGIPYGEFEIQETNFADYTQQTAFCHFEDFGFPWSYTMPNGLYDGSFDLGLHPEDGPIHMICDWVNFQGGGAGSMTNIKLLCPPGYVPEAEGADPLVDCADTLDGVTFHLSDGNPPGPDATRQSGDDGPGTATFDDIEPGTWTVTEEAPPYIERVHALCPSINGGGPMFHDDAPRVEFEIELGEDWSCYWLNIPGTDEVNGIELFKWECPEGTEPGHEKDWYEATCVLQHNGIPFTVSSSEGIVMLETAGGAAIFPGLPVGTVGIQETIPDGFGPPTVFCGVEGAQHYPAPTGYWEHEFPEDGLSEILICHVYNIPGEPGSVTILKWTCPPGYDLFAAGADPKADCTEATNGVQFQFGLDSIAAIAELQTTGDIIDGGVIFEGLDPDVYKAVELVPDGIASVFVLECTGHIMGVLQPYPLQIGNVLGGIDVDAGEHLVCDWYNVPEDEGGKLTLIKYICSTETFVSEVDCEIHEDGATFDLLFWNTDDGVWEIIDTDTTDGAGRIVWPDLSAGDYHLDEHDGEWCHFTTTPVFGPGEVFSVFEGDETVVEIYNCDSGWTTTTIPREYPNTGAGPSDDSTSGAIGTPAMTAPRVLPHRSAARGRSVHTNRNRPRSWQGAIAA